MRVLEPTRLRLGGYSVGRLWEVNRIWDIGYIDSE
jgi:hypothetical protein